MTEPAPEQPIDSLRGRLSDAATQIPGLDTLIAIVADACKATRKVRVGVEDSGPCAKCGCQHVRWAVVNDAKVARETLAFVMEQTEGRPGVADGHDAGVVVIRQVIGLDEPVA